MRSFLSLILLVSLAGATTAQAQYWNTVSGIVTEQGSPLRVSGVTVVVSGTNFGTASDASGNYSLRLPTGRYALQFSAIGYESRTDSVVILRESPTSLDVEMRVDTISLDEITVEEAAEDIQVGVFQLDPRDIQNLPSPMKDVVRALKVVPGVASNNELSNQYSVRGGGYNENLLFLNGFEVYLPFRPRQGEQEGLSLLNPDLAENVTFYTGGFPLRYGGKLSSALEVDYANPMQGSPTGTIYGSLLDAGISVRAPIIENKVGFVGGIRRAQASHFFATQELKGTYEPTFIDLQGAFTFQLTDRQQLEVVGVFADHEFQLDPNTRKTFFGTVSQDPRIAPNNLKSLWTTFDPDNLEIDGYRTTFGGARLTSLGGRNFTASHDLSYFMTSETEFFDLSGTAILFKLEPGDDPETGEGLLATGTSRQEDSADNEVNVTTLTAKGNYTYKAGSNLIEGGWYARDYSFTDRIDERSVVTGPNLDGDIVRIVADSLRDSAELGAQQLGAYVSNTMQLVPSSPGKLVGTIGVRADYFTFNEEVTVSPRLFLNYRHSPLWSFFGSTGIYHQAPTYRELRGKPEAGETILGALNSDLKSQRSYQTVIGAERFFSGSRLTLRGEAYYKAIRNVISYDLENVRIRYSGDNDAKSDTYGLDLQLRGEFVPGLESWVNYSYLKASENFLPSFTTTFNEGTISRPTDQRHTISIYVQDYIPNSDEWKIHMRTLFGSGLPYTPPVPGEQIGNVLIQEAGPRNSARYPRYFRFDLGASYSVPIFERGIGGPISLDLTGELLNVFDMINTVSYYWVPNSEGIWNRIPTRLTPRTINVRAKITF